MNATKLLLPFAEAARLLGVSRVTLYKLIGLGKLKPVRCGARRRLRRRDVERLAEKGWKD